MEKLDSIFEILWKPKTGKLLEEMECQNHRKINKGKKDVPKDCDLSFLATLVRRLSAE